MMRWLVAALFLCASVDIAACPLCMGYRPSTAQQLAVLQQAVLAQPATDGRGYRVVATIKGEPPSSGMIEATAVQADGGAPASGKPLLLARDDKWPIWLSFGAIGAEHAGWLRQIVAGKSATEMSAEEWRARVALMLPYLENREPLVAEIAYGELAAAPYAALSATKSQLATARVRQWLADPKLAARQPMYLLLLGLGGNAQDAAVVERRLDEAWRAGDAMNLGSLIAADLQLRGPVRVAWVDERYLNDSTRSSREVEAALLALSVHGNANTTVPRERVIKSYRMFMTAHKDIAGYVAQDFAAWRYWDAVPDYVALLKAGVKQQYPSQIAIIAYLRQSPAGKAGSIDLPLSEGLPLQQSTGMVPKAGSIPVLPQ
jgi:hypothetical protein